MIKGLNLTQNNSYAAIDQLKELENITRELEPGSTARKEIMEQVTGYVDQFIEVLPGSQAYTKMECENLRGMKFEEEGKPFNKMLNILKTEVDQAGINSASGKHFGYIPGGGLWSSAVADLLAAAANRYVGIYYSSPGAVIIENQLIRWLCSIVDYPAEAHGNLTSGGSIANLIALKAAKDFHKINSSNVKKAVVYFTEQTHHCIDKALNITGLDEAVLRRIPLNDNFQMDTDLLKGTIEADMQDGLSPFLVIGTAGTTDTGAIDPLNLIADICEKYKTWFHVDAAYGGFFMLVNELKEKFNGIARSDSVVMDPHKSLFIPYGSGAVLLKNGKRLLESNSHKASYMQDSYGFDEISPSDSGFELSRHFRGLRLWIPLHLHGVNTFRANLYEKFLLCRYFHKRIKELGFETGPEPELSITFFRLPSDNGNVINQKLLNALQADGRCFFSSTIINDKFWIRCAVLSFRTHLPEIEMALEMIKENLTKIN